MDDAENSARKQVGRPFEPGVSGNPGGRPKKVQAYRAAILQQETVERVCEVVNAMREGALAGGKSAPACAKVYLGACGISTEGKPDEDFADALRAAPPEVVEFIAKLRN